jgi:peptidoglycan-associated lipoprotein
MLKSRTFSSALLLSLAIALLLITGCAKKPAAAKVQPPPPAPPQPVVTLSVYPAQVQQGQSAKLSWEAQNATDVAIEPVGPVNATGSQNVNPTESTTYRIVARGPGGSADSSARLTVVANAPPVAAAPEPTLRELFERNMKDAFFAYDDYKLDAEGQQLVASDARFLQQHPELKFTVEGHCDERGSDEYNLALGASRAEAVKQSLIAQGIDAQRMNATSAGKEKPFCTESNEECWHLNRRGHFLLP